MHGGSRGGLRGSSSGGLHGGSSPFGRLAPPFLALADTTVLGDWDFDAMGTCSFESWTSHDLTEQGQFWHVDDFDGLGGGDFGRLFSLEGNQSMWLGARPSASDPELCNYATLPGYGDSWWQMFCTPGCQTVSGDVIIDFLASWDTEPAEDGWWFQYDHCDDSWVTLPESCPGGACMDGIAVDSLMQFTIPSGLHSGSLRIRFTFASDGAWSDEDALWDTDGAVIMDSLTVTDATGIVLPTETFESEALGASATLSGNWSECNQPGYGDFAGLFTGVTLVQQDPCASNISCMWAFISGSTYNYACGGFPTQPVVPYGNANDQYIDNEVRSPLISLSGTGSDFRLEFDTYSELTLDALIMNTWRVRSFVGGCPGPWKTEYFVYWYQAQGWYRTSQQLAPFIDPAATHIQVALGLQDMCPFWCGSVGTGNCHSHTPLYDNVRVLRVDHNGPQWSVRDIDLFQDNFAGDGTLTGTVRADRAEDRLPTSNPNILPGDGVYVRVDDPVTGLAADPGTGFGSAVYCYVRVDSPTQAKTGAALSDDPFRFPVVDSLTLGSDTWYCVRLDSSFSGPGYRENPVEDRFVLDLNDNLFTPGDTIHFVFSAENTLAQRTWWSEFTGTTDDMATALGSPMEFTCLPTGAGLFLYVDGFDGRGAQPLFDDAFRQLGIEELTDRYDKRGPTSLVNNGLGSRVVDAAAQLADRYSFIIWNTGDLSIGTIGDGTGSPEKTNDALVLTTFLEELDIVYYPTTSPRDPVAGIADAVGTTAAAPAGNGTLPGRSSPRARGAIGITGARGAVGITGVHGAAGTTEARGAALAALDSIPPHSGGIYFSGDDIADDLYNRSAPGPDLIALQGWIPGTVTNNSHRNAGYGASPLVVAEVPSCFSESNPDTLIAFGGCPTLNDFDLIAPAGSSALEMSYHGPPGTAGAIISQVTTNGKGAAAAVMLSGFSYHEIRQHGAPGGVGPDHVEHLGDILFWMGWFIPTGADQPPPAPDRNRLAQNYPNPFNPSTTIAFEVRNRTRVTLRIYNVAGQRVRTLIDDVRAPGVTHTVEWDGRNTHGQAVATGVYFYRIATRGFVSTRKMVLLK